MDILNDINFLMLKLYEVLIFIYCQNCRQASGMLLQGFLISKPHAVIYKILLSKTIDILHDSNFHIIWSHIIAQCMQLVIMIKIKLNSLLQEPKIVASRILILNSHAVIYKTSLDTSIDILHDIYFVMLKIYEVLICI